MLMLFRKWQWEASKTSGNFLSLSYDSSPQLQYDYLIIKEEVCFSPPVFDTDQPTLSQARLETRIKPATTIGYGESGVEQKLA
eukprot:6374886-Alexandrium_andersonii.AAC.1